MPKIIRTEEKKAKEVSFEVIEEILKLPTRKNGSVVRIDYGTWNDGDPKYELRLWKEKDGVMQPTKGIGLSGEELIFLREALNRMEVEE